MDCMLAGAAIRHQAPKFCGEIFANGHKTSKAFSLKSFPLYGMQMLGKRSM